MAPVHKGRTVIPADQSSETVRSRRSISLACPCRPYMSGYTEDTVLNQGILRAGMLFLQKPFSPLGLAVKVRDALDR